jgi:hypothetical protein
MRKGSHARPDFLDNAGKLGARRRREWRHDAVSSCSDQAQSAFTIAGCVFFSKRKIARDKLQCATSRIEFARGWSPALNYGKSAKKKHERFPAAETHTVVSSGTSHVDPYSLG